MPTFNENSIEITRWDRIVRIFMTDAKGPRRIRRHKVRCSNKKHTPWVLRFHKIHDRLSNYKSHLVLN